MFILMGFSSFFIVFRMLLMSLYMILYSRILIFLLFVWFLMELGVLMLKLKIMVLFAMVSLTLLVFMFLVVCNSNFSVTLVCGSIWSVCLMVLMDFWLKF